MVLYVDIVRNDLRRGQQQRVALLELEGEDLRIYTDEERLQTLVADPVVSPETGEEVYPQKNPREYLSILHEVYGGSYIFATEPYSDPSASRFAESDRIRLAHVS